MRGVVVAGAVTAAMLAAAAPAGAVQIGISGADMGPVPPGPEQSVWVQAAPGENNHVTVRATDPNATADPNDYANGWPLTVTVTDTNGTFTDVPPSGALPCQILDAHTARCTATAYFVQAIMQLGDGNNTLDFASDTVPLREEITTSDGNDDISTGPFAGDASYRWASSTGAGNDTVHIGPWARAGIDSGPIYGYPQSGLAIYTGPGNDTIYAANGAYDEVDCADGNDTLYADAWDSESVYTEPGGTCENRVLPSVPLPQM